MILTSKNRLLAVAGSVLTGTLLLYGCKDFLTNNAVPQGAVTGATLTTKSGVEGMLIATYRALDCNYQTAAWGCAVSNWVFGSVPSDDVSKNIRWCQWCAPDCVNRSGSNIRNSCSRPPPTSTKGPISSNRKR